MNILETSGIYFDYKGLEVLFNVNLQIEKGERHAVIGPNGAGKTTLFDVIIGGLHPSRGKVTFKEHDISRATPHELFRHGIGRSFQITSTYAKQTPFQNVRSAILSKRGIRFNIWQRVDKLDDVTRETNEVLKRLNLFEERDVPASALSYGKNRSLEFGMAVASDPDLIMLDEPASGMSRDETHAAVDLIRDLSEGKSMIIIEHDMDVVFSLADRITVLHHGQILATGAPNDIKNNQQVRDAYLGETEV
ncbi:MAG: ABC transporter ATP-binding protein [Deltaproteobacteria bacterium]|nr:ABC transporter ATP-binding protein [Deltaproteobacteria bacterium]